MTAPSRPALRHNPAALFRARMDKGLTQVQLARLAQISQPYLSTLENGTQSPSEERLASLARFLGVAPDSLRAAE